MAKKDSILQHGQKRINKQLLPHEWLDDAMPMSDSSNGSSHDYNPRDNKFDANSIDNFDDLENHPVIDYNGKIVGYRSEIRNKKKRL